MSEKIEFEKIEDDLNHTFEKTFFVAGECINTQFNLCGYSSSVVEVNYTDKIICIGNKGTYKIKKENMKKHLTKILIDLFIDNAKSCGMDDIRDFKLLAFNNIEL